MKHWKVWAALRNPKGMRVNLNTPKGVVMAVFDLYHQIPIEPGDIPIKMKTHSFPLGGGGSNSRGGPHIPTTYTVWQMNSIPYQFCSVPQTISCISTPVSSSPLYRKEPMQRPSTLSSFF